MNFPPPKLAWLPMLRPPPPPPPPMPFAEASLVAATEAVARAATATAAVMSFLIVVIVTLPGSECEGMIAFVDGQTLEPAALARCDGDHRIADLARSADGDIWEQAARGPASDVCDGT